MNREHKGEAAKAWWSAMQAERGGLAQLRRAARPIDAMTSPAAVELARELGFTRAGFESAAVCAAVLAHVRDDVPGTRVAAQLAAGAQPVMSPVRFRRLVEAEDAGERLQRFRRLVALLDGRTNVADLAAAVLDWSERRRRDWIFTYHGGSAPSAPRLAPRPGQGDDT